MKSPAKLIFIFSIVFLNSSVWAVDFFRGPISSALGGGGRAGLSGTESAFINPALLPLVKNFQFVATYRDGQVDVGQHRQGLALGAVDDSEDAYFPGSLHYLKTRDAGRSPLTANNEIWHAAGAYLVNNQLSVGLSAFHINHKIKRDRDYEQWNFTLGTVYLINNDFAVAYVLDNLAHPSGKLPMGLREDMQQGLGLFYRVAEMATIRADITRRERYNPDHKLTYMAGIESATSRFMVFRFGFRREELEDRRVWTAGLGFNGPRLKVNYSVEKTQERASGALHSVDMQVPF